MAKTIELMDHQKDALARLSSGSILYGGVGSGKTLTALAYYLENNRGKKLLVITTAKKRDDGDWVKEAEMIGVPEQFLKVDSWNNIAKYVGLKDCLILFDEQRVVGSGAWVRSFLKLAKNNEWLLLSATPGDNWMDYIPVFIANGFYRNKTEFIDLHVEYDRYSTYPKVRKYHNVPRLNKYRDLVLVPMKFERKTNRTRIFENIGYDKLLYEEVRTKKINPFTKKPIKRASEYTQVMRKIVATSQDRISRASQLIMKIDKLIVFYNYDYEREILIDLADMSGKMFSEWSGHIHGSIPKTDKWIYLVQYTAGAEGWNNIETDSIMFYSPNYSYKIIEQAEGRIDRLNTPFTELKYYYLSSTAPIDEAVYSAIRKKKKFNESYWGR